VKPLAEEEVPKEKPIYLEESENTFWHNVEGDGPFRVEISLGSQVASFYKGSVLTGQSIVATGRPMPYWMRLTSYGIGMHVGPIPYPGSPASHGCIRLPEGPARLVFASAKVGTPVKIIP